jgi:hypothetical protein
LASCPRHLAADSAYGSAANLAWLVKERQIEPHIPVFDKSNRTDGTFSRSDFVFDAERNHYTCPQGKLLVQFRRTYATPRSGITKDGTRLYRSSKSDCQGCAFKAKCCPNTPQRKVPRDLDEDARDVARVLANTPAYERSRHRRKKVEMLFAHLKRHPQTRSPQIVRSERRARRIPTRCHSPEPEEARKASSDASRLPRASMTAPKKSTPMTGPILRQHPNK